MFHKKSTENWGNRFGYNLGDELKDYKRLYNRETDGKSDESEYDVYLEWREAVRKKYSRLEIEDLRRFYWYLNQEKRDSEEINEFEDIFVNPLCVGVLSSVTVLNFVDVIFEIQLPLFWVLKVLIWIVLSVFIISLLGVVFSSIIKKLFSKGRHDKKVKEFFYEDFMAEISYIIEKKKELS